MIASLLKTKQNYAAVGFSHSKVRSMARSQADNAQNRSTTKARS